MAYFEQFKQLDAQTLFSGSVSSATVGSAIDTSNFGNIVVQFSSTQGSGQIQAYIEGTNDQLEWFPLILNPINDLAVTDTITAEGGYQFKTSFKYIRTNVTYVSGTYNITILGRAGTGENSSDTLAAAFNPDTPLQVAFGAGVKQDKNGALILSDGIPFYLNGNNNTYIINLNGYSSIYLQLSGAQTLTTFQSIDGTLWSACWFGINSGTSISSTPNAAGIWVGAVMGQYLKIVVSGAVATTMTAAVVLKQAPFNGNYFNTGISPVNVQQHQSATWQNAGVVGVPAVAGPAQAGSAASAYPMPIAGVDAGNILRRPLTDTAGRLIANNQMGSVYISGANTANTNYALSSNTAYPQNYIGILPATFQQSAALNVQDTSQFEGQTRDELLSQILLELRILNQQIYELPVALATSNYSEAPENYRSEQSIFKQ